MPSARVLHYESARLFPTPAPISKSALARWWRSASGDSEWLSVESVSRAGDSGFELDAPLMRTCIVIATGHATRRLGRLGTGRGCMNHCPDARAAESNLAAARAMSSASAADVMEMIWLTLTDDRHLGAVVSALALRARRRTTRRLNSNSRCHGAGRPTDESGGSALGRGGAYKGCGERREWACHAHLVSALLPR